MQGLSSRGLRNDHAYLSLYHLFPDLDRFDAAEGCSTPSCVADLTVCFIIKPCTVLQTGDQIEQVAKVVVVRSPIVVSLTIPDPWKRRVAAPRLRAFSSLVQDPIRSASDKELLILGTCWTPPLSLVSEKSGAHRQSNNFNLFVHAT